MPNRIRAPLYPPLVDGGDFDDYEHGASLARRPGWKPLDLAAKVIGTEEDSAETDDLE